MMLHTGSASLRSLIKVCCHNVLNENFRFKSRFTATAASANSNRRGRAVSRGKQHTSSHPNDGQMKNFLDDELYFDRDFDYIDHKQLNLQKRLNVKYLQQDVDESPKEILGRKYRNALYEDDEDDLKLAKTKRDAGYNKQIISKLHRQFETELHVKKQFASGETGDDSQQTQEKQSQLERLNSRKEKKTRTLVPLPYDITEENRFNILNQIVIPYFKMPYHVQLKKKYHQNVEILRRFGNKLYQMDGPVRVGRNGLPCPLEPVRASPRTERYRNKDEFSVWPGIDGHSKTVGFFVGQPSVHDRVICVEPDQIVITKQSHIDIAAKFQQYLREVSPYDSCQNYGVGGNWRRIHIRSNQLEQHMVTAIMHPQELTTEQLQEEMDRLQAYFGDDARIGSLYFHATRHTRSTHTGEKYHHLAGNATISEQLFDKHFVISPSSFFQVNTAAAEVLYRVIMTEVDAKPKKTTLLDLCCGTGTLSVLMANHVKRVIAIDSSQSAIEDARRNAAANNVNNITFFTGTVEEILPKLAEENYLSGHVVAVANPSRRALHPNAIRTLRRMNYIEKFVYVSCKADGDAFNNFVHLCRPRSDSGSPFVVINAVPVDLFPHTPHCELVLSFERF